MRLASGLNSKNWVLAVWEYRHPLISLRRSIIAENNIAGHFLDSPYETGQRFLFLGEVYWGTITDLEYLITGSLTEYVALAWVSKVVMPEATSLFIETGGNGIPGSASQRASGCTVFSSTKRKFVPESDVSMETVMYRAAEATRVGFKPISRLTSVLAITAAVVSIWLYPRQWWAQVTTSMLDEIELASRYSAESWGFFGDRRIRSWVIT